MLAYSRHHLTKLLMSSSSLTQKGLQLSKNAIFNVFSSRAGRLLGRPFKVVTVLNEVADKLADQKSKDNKFRQLLDTMLTVVRLVRCYVSGEYRQISTKTIIAGLAVLLYVLSPIDLVPDFIPVVGFLDDLSLISWFVASFQVEINRFREWERTAAKLLPTGPDKAAQPARSDKQQPAIAELGHS